jgi:hypothetical protein
MIARRFLTEYDTSAQIEHAGVAERSESWRPLGAGAGWRYRSPFRDTRRRAMRSEIQRCRRLIDFCNCVGGLVLQRQLP